MKKMPPLLELGNVSVMLGQTRALDNISLAVGADEDIAILGPNGSGKSTLIKVITRQCYPLAGMDVTVKIFGQETWDVFELRSRFGIVSAGLQAEYFRDLTVREAILSGFFSSIGLFSNHRVTEAMEKKTGEILEFLEVPHLAEKNMDEISSGEARRVLIGRALVHDPKALVLDEPTNSLDIHAARRFRDILRKIARGGRNVILVTHHLHDIIPEIRRVVLLRNGRVLEDGKKEEMLTGENLSRVFDVSVDVLQKDGYYHAM